MTIGTVAAKPVKQPKPLRRERTGSGSYVTTSLLAEGVWSARVSIQAAQLVAILDEVFAEQPMAHWYEVFSGVRVTFGAMPTIV